MPCIPVFEDLQAMAFGAEGGLRSSPMPSSPGVVEIHDARLFMVATMANVKILVSKPEPV